MLAANEAVAETLASGPSCTSSAASTKPPEPRKAQGADRVRRGAGLQDRQPGEPLRAAEAAGPRWPAGPSSTPSTTPCCASLQRAVYSPEEEGHYALASDCYCHFTSPIRRYPDLTVHRLVDALLTKKKPRNDFDELVVLGEHCSDREQRAEAAERELTKLKLLDYLSERIGEEMDAVVTGVESSACSCRASKLPAEGLDPRQLAGRRLLPLRAAVAHPVRPPVGQHLSAGRRGARGRCAGRRRTPRVGLPRRPADGPSQARGEAGPRDSAGRNARWSRCFRSGW